MSYTLSRSERQINGINNNDWYVTKYDKPHNLSVVGLYAVSPRLTLSCTFNYGTGIATTMPDSRYEYQGLVVPYVTGDRRNNYRVPAYHRLDLAATWQQERNAGRRWQGEWVFSLYNTYGRKNPYSISLRQLPEVVGFAVGVLFGELQPVVQMINDDDAPGAKQPGAAGSHNPDGSGPKHDHGIAFLNAPLFGRLVARGGHIGQHDSIFNVHPFRNYGRAHIGIGNAHVFGLSAVVAPAIRA